MSNANNNNYISPSAVANNSPVLHNNHIMNNNHQHLHQSNLNYNIGSSSGQMLNNEIQSTAGFYQHQHQFMPHHQRVVGADGNMLINSNAMPPSLVNHSTNGLAQHIKSRNNRLMKNNGLNNNFYRSSGIFYCIAICCVYVCVHLIFFAFAFYLINFIVSCLSGCHSIFFLLLYNLTSPTFTLVALLHIFILLSTVALTISVKAILNEKKKFRSFILVKAHLLLILSYIFPFQVLNFTLYRNNYNENYRSKRENAIGVACRKIFIIFSIKLLR